MKKHFCRAAAGFLILMLLTACGGRQSSSRQYYKEETWAATEAAGEIGYAAEGQAPMAPMAMHSVSGNSVAMTAAEEAAWDAAEAPSPVSEEDLGGTASQDMPVSRKLIRNVNLILQTTEYDTVVDNIRRRVSELEGYIEQSDAYDSGYNQRSGRSMNMTVRIPNDRLDAFLETASLNAKVTNRTETTQDITLKYTDMEARVGTLEVERQRLTELLAEADSIESIIALESRLSEIRYELESIRSSLRVYDNQVAYSTVWISISEVQVIQETREATFAERLSARFKQNLLDLLDTVTELLIDLISNLPGILLLVLVIWAIVKIVTAIFGKENREERKAKKLLKKELKQRKKDEKNGVVRREAAAASGEETPSAKASADPSGDAGKSAEG